MNYDNKYNYGLYFDSVQSDYDFWNRERSLIQTIPPKYIFILLHIFTMYLIMNVYMY